MNVTEIVALIFVAVGAGAFIYLLPQIKALIPQVDSWIKTHTSAEQREVLADLAAQLVGAAEQLFGAKKGEQKKAYSMELLAKLMPHVDEAVRNAAIEDEVFRMNQTKA